MSVRIGHASRPEGSGVNGVAGDQTGAEVCVRTWYNIGADYIAIHPDASVREKHAKACEAGCANDHIGYSQFGTCNRNTLNNLAAKVGYDLSKITTNCNTDCSAFQNVCAVASGASGVKYGSNGWTTSTMKAALKAAGYIIITTSKYLTSADYCVRGAIYVKASSHTVCGLDNGSKASETLKAAGITSSGASASNTPSASGATQTAGATVKVDYARSRNTELSGTYKVTAKDGLRLRAGAGTNKAIITTMPYGATVQCYGYYTDVSGVKWLYVVYKGQDGFASSEYLRK